MASRDGKAVHAKSRKGVIVLIARADRFYSEVLPALQNFEFFFNARFQYPYVILSEDPIDEYQQLQLSSLSQGKASWGQMTPDWWGPPPNTTDDELQRLLENPPNAIVGQSRFGLNYRNMCRFWAGLFYQHPLLEPYDYFWRLDGDLRFQCHMTSDPIRDMERAGQIYGYGQVSIEYPEVVVGLWKLFDSFIAASEPKLLPQNLTFLTSSDGTYNHWMYYTNFEISHRSLFKNPWWPQLWQQMEDSRAIHWARWGDAPIRTMWVHAFAKNSQIARIEDAVYSHGGFGFQCPRDPYNCVCSP